MIHDVKHVLCFYYDIKNNCRDGGTHFNHFNDEGLSSHGSEREIVFQLFLKICECACRQFINGVNNYGHRFSKEYVTLYMEAVMGEHKVELYTGPEDDRILGYRFFLVFHPFTEHPQDNRNIRPEDLMGLNLKKNESRQQQQQQPPPQDDDNDDMDHESPVEINQAAFLHDIGSRMRDDDEPSPSVSRTSSLSNMNNRRGGGRQKEFYVTDPNTIFKHVLKHSSILERTRQASISYITKEIDRMKKRKVEEKSIHVEDNMRWSRIFLGEECIWPYLVNLYLNSDYGTTHSKNFSSVPYSDPSHPASITKIFNMVNAFHCQNHSEDPLEPQSIAGLWKYFDCVSVDTYATSPKDVIRWPYPAYVIKIPNNDVTVDTLYNRMFPHLQQPFKNKYKDVIACILNVDTQKSFMCNAVHCETTRALNRMSQTRAEERNAMSRKKHRNMEQQDQIAKMYAKINNLPEDSVNSFKASPPPPRVLHETTQVWRLDSTLVNMQDYHGAFGTILPPSRANIDSIIKLLARCKSRKEMYLNIHIENDKILERLNDIDSKIRKRVNEITKNPKKVLVKIRKHIRHYEKEYRRSNATDFVDSDKDDDDDDEEEDDREYDSLPDQLQSEAELPPHLLREDPLLRSLKEQYTNLKATHEEKIRSTKELDSDPLVNISDPEVVCRKLYLLNQDSVFEQYIQNCCSADSDISPNGRLICEAIEKYGLFELYGENKITYGLSNDTSLFFDPSLNGFCNMQITLFLQFEMVLRIKNTHRIMNLLLKCSLDSYRASFDLHFNIGIISEKGGRGKSYCTGLLSALRIPKTVFSESYRSSKAEATEEQNMNDQIVVFEEMSVELINSKSNKDMEAERAFKERLTSHTVTSRRLVKDEDGHFYQKTTISECIACFIFNTNAPIWKYMSGAFCSRFMLILLEDETDEKHLMLELKISELVQKSDAQTNIEYYRYKRTHMVWQALVYHVEKLIHLGGLTDVTMEPGLIFMLHVEREMTKYGMKVPESRAIVRTMIIARINVIMDAIRHLFFTERGKFNNMKIDVNMLKHLDRLLVCNSHHIVSAIGETIDQFVDDTGELARRAIGKLADQRPSVTKFKSTFFQRSNDENSAARLSVSLNNIHRDYNYIEFQIGGSWSDFYHRVSETCAGLDKTTHSLSKMTVEKIITSWMSQSIKGKSLIKGPRIYSMRNKGSYEVDIDSQDIYYDTKNPHTPVHKLSERQICEMDSTAKQKIIRFAYEFIFPERVEVAVKRFESNFNQNPEKTIRERVIQRETGGQMVAERTIDTREVHVVSDNLSAEPVLGFDYSAPDSPRLEMHPDTGPGSGGIMCSDTDSSADMFVSSAAEVGAQSSIAVAATQKNTLALTDSRASAVEEGAQSSTAVAATQKKVETPPDDPDPNMPKETIARAGREILVDIIKSFFRARGQRSHKFVFDSNERYPFVLNTIDTEAVDMDDETRPYLTIKSPMYMDTIIRECLFDSRRVHDESTDDSLRFDLEGLSLNEEGDYEHTEKRFDDTIKKCKEEHQKRRRHLENYYEKQTRANESFLEAFKKSPYIQVKLDFDVWAHIQRNNVLYITEHPINPNFRDVINVMRKTFTNSQVGGLRETKYDKMDHNELYNTFNSIACVDAILKTPREELADRENFDTDEDWRRATKQERWRRIEKRIDEEILCLNVVSKQSILLGRDVSDMPMAEKMWELRNAEYKKKNKAYFMGEQAELYLRKARDDDDDSDFNMGEEEFVTTDEQFDKNVSSMGFESQLKKKGKFTPFLMSLDSHEEDYESPDADYNVKEFCALKSGGSSEFIATKFGQHFSDHPDEFKMICYVPYVMSYLEKRRVEMWHDVIFNSQWANYPNGTIEKIEGFREHERKALEGNEHPLLKQNGEGDNMEERRRRKKLSTYSTSVSKVDTQNKWKQMRTQHYSGWMSTQFSQSAQLNGEMIQHDGQFVTPRMKEKRDAKMHTRANFQKLRRQIDRKNAQEHMIVQERFENIVNLTSEENMDE